jgi:transcriptional regulator with XRE-family HTH domain
MDMREGIDEYDEEIENRVELQVKKIIARLREERENARISQMELSFMAGLSQNLVNSLENGHSSPNIGTILRICYALDIEPSSLFTVKNEERQRIYEKIVHLVKLLV